MLNRYVERWYGIVPRLSLALQHLEHSRKVSGTEASQLYYPTIKLGISELGLLVGTDVRQEGMLASQFIPNIFKGVAVRAFCRLLDVAILE